MFEQSTKTKLVWAGVLTAMGAIVLAYFIFGRSRVTAENFRQVRFGMTLAQVEAILGQGTFKEVSSKVVDESMVRAHSLPPQMLGKPYIIYDWEDGLNFVQIRFAGDYVNSEMRNERVCRWVATFP